MLVPRTVRERSQLPMETQKNGIQTNCTCMHHFKIENYSVKQPILQYKKHKVQTVIKIMEVAYCFASKISCGNTQSQLNVTTQMLLQLLQCLCLSKTPRRHETFCQDTSKPQMVWFGLLLFNGIFSTNRLYRAIGVWNISRRAKGQHKHTIEQWNNTINQENHKKSLAWALWRWSPRHG